tara:strand:- start:1402 stop:1959 length:558 start_codon:yes stop_codon:yes gene_type:complete
MNNNIKSYKLKLNGVYLLNIPINIDKRGSFSEVYNNEINKSLGVKVDWIQDNESVSNKNVFRGLHFQKSKFVQSKLIRVSNGKILDIMLDLRKNSSTYKKYISVKMDQRNNILFIPKGIAHGFLSLTDNTILNYKCDNLYNPDFESGVNPFKSELNIKWGIDLNNIIVSKKDSSFPSLKNSYVFN